MPIFLAKTALLPKGWSSDVLITVDNAGWITDVKEGQSADIQRDEYLDGAVIPGMPNLHSHAFQRHIAGKTEYATAEHDSFWTWRKLMYGALETLEAEELEEIAFNLYKEMLAAGYTHVGEFHYVHHRPDGTPYDDRNHLSHCMIRAAKSAGIGVTILPVLYVYSGFGDKAAEEGQRRFINTPDQYIDMVSRLYADYKADPAVRVGAAFHSLRAVNPDMINHVTAALQKIDVDMPFHIHIAEQEKEIEDCLNHNGKRPVEFLFEHVDVDQNWCLVHATHMTEDETQSVASSGAVAGVCPVTEASLGDGLFNLPPYIKAGGVWGIGSDSHISVDVVEELRWFEYGQRLLRKQRAIARTEKQPHVGDFLYIEALRGGAQALGGKLGAIDVGNRADFIVLPDQQDVGQNIRLDTAIFTDRLPIQSVYTGGVKRA
jgi:formimidoylglutamate deiminase